MANTQKLKIGEILVQSGVVTLEQLQRALKMQVQSGCLLGEALIKLGFAAEADISKAMARQMGIPYASRENKILRVEKGQSLEKVVSERFAREQAVLPLFLDDGTLAVAMADPENVMVIDNLKLMTGHEIQPFVSTRAEVLEAIDEFYGGGRDLIDKAMEKGGPEEGVAEEVDFAETRLDLDKVLSEARGAQTVGLVNAILKQAVAERCSDIHLERFDEQVTLRFRVDGVLYERTPPPPDHFNAVVSRIKILSKLDIAERRLPQDGTFSVKIQDRIIDVRVSLCPTVFGEKVVLRILDKGAVALDVDSLGFEDRQKKDFLAASQYPHGLIFLTGPTGSGKTTTLYAVLNTIMTPEKNFMTVEDPVEIKLSGVNQVQVKGQIGLTFAAAIRSFLRQDPDVILVGEVRDQETAQTCLRASLTGHLVLSTLHTNSALDAVVRLVDLGIEPFLLASSLALVAAQRLVRVLCPACKAPARPEPAMLNLCLREAMFVEPPDPASVVFYQAKGCDKCAGTGFTGRKGIYEVYLVDQEMRDVIYKHGGDLIQLRATAAKSGVWTLRASGWRKVLAGVTTPEEVVSITLGS